ncbi:MAG: HNH endonuclease [Bacteroidia bacterium]
MRPVHKQKNYLTYTQYGDAKPLLINQLGQFCSYCERYVNPESALEVEHVLYKDKYTRLETSWRNFLLSCKHCNTIKGQKEIDFSHIHLPHLHNTFLSFTYQPSGKITINSAIKGTSEEPKAQALMGLVGLDREPSNKKYNSSDNLVEKRRNAWALAKRYLDKYEASPPTTDIDCLIDLVRSNGFWSIWMKVFENHTEVRKELITVFDVPRTACFDNTTTIPKPRRKNRII